MTHQEPSCSQLGGAASADQRPLRLQTYYALGGEASSGVCAPNCLAHLQRVFGARARTGEALAVVGAGSNMICSEQTFPGLFVSCRNMIVTQWLVLSKERGELFCEAGLTNTELAEWGLEAGFADAAWMFRMPGQIGATVRMNARCYGGEISQIVSSIYTLSLDGSIRAWAAADIFRGYKNTLLMDVPEIVIGVVVQFCLPEARSEILKKMDTCEHDRNRKQHFLYPSCGSTFKNNYVLGKPSGQVFDELGFRGLARGQAQISPHHANFIYNTGGACSEDVLELALEMRQKALDNGMNLMLEVQPVGLFPQRLCTGLALDQLDPRTQKIPGEQVLTGVLKGLGVTCPQSESGRLERPILHVAHPLLAWHGEQQDWLGHVQFRVQQLRPVVLDAGVPIAGDTSHVPDEPLLEIEFCDASGGDLRRLLNVAPVSGCPGFQDGLWTSSVFECFIFSGDHVEDPYLEAEAHSAESWLALCFKRYRERAACSQKPLASDFPGLSIESVSDPASGCLKSLRFTFTQRLLWPYLMQNAIRVQGAYTRSGAQFALAAHPGQAAAAASGPDFHRAANSFLIRLK